MLDLVRKARRSITVKDRQRGRDHGQDAAGLGLQARRLVWRRDRSRRAGAPHRRRRSGDPRRRRPAPAAPAATLRAAGALAHRLNIAPEDADEIANVAAVEQHMTELMRVPTVRAGAVMADACPAGSAPGTIPVGGVVAVENAIHPGMYSADICCSLAVSIFRDLAPTAALDAAMPLSHFGGGGRPRGEQLRPPADILSAFESNPFLKDV